MKETDIYQFKSVHGYWNKYILPRPPSKKKNRIDNEEQFRFEDLQGELCRIMNKILGWDEVDGKFYRVSVACKRRNGGLYTKILFDYRFWWSVTSYMVDLQKKTYKYQYMTRDEDRIDKWESVEGSEFYDDKIQKMILEFIEYSEQRMRDSDGF